MSASARFKRSARRLVKRFGESITLTRSHSVRDVDARLPLSTLELSGIHAINATTLTLKAPDDGPLGGTIPKNLILTIDSVEYTVSAEAEASANAFSVTIPSPGLTSGQAADTSVTLAASATYTLTGAYSDIDASKIGPAMADSVTARIKIASAGSVVTPQNHDYVTARGRTDLVHQIRDRPGGWELLVGAA